MLNLFYGLEGCRQHAGTALLLYIGESGKQVDIFIAAISYDLQNQNPSLAIITVIAPVDLKNRCRNGRSLLDRIAEVAGHFGK